MQNVNKKICPLCGKPLGKIMGKKCKGNHNAPWKKHVKKGWRDWMKNKNSEKWKKYIEKWQQTRQKNNILLKDKKSWERWDRYNKKMPIEYKIRDSRKHKKN